jgi:hypothetical protein
MWSAFLVIGVAVGGTMVFRKYQTEAAVGFLLGCTGMMAQLFFVMFAVFVGLGSNAASDTQKDVEKTFAAFAFFLMIAYFLVTVFLFMYRGDLIPVEAGSAPAGSVPLGDNDEVRKEEAMSDGMVPAATVSV